MTHITRTASGKIATIRVESLPYPHARYVVGRVKTLDGHVIAQTKPLTSSYQAEEQAERLAEMA